MNPKKEKNKTKKTVQKNVGTCWFKWARTTLAIRNMDHAEIKILWYAKNKNKLFISMGFPRAEEIANIDNFTEYHSQRKASRLKRVRELGGEEEEVTNGKKCLLC